MTENRRIFLNIVVTYGRSLYALVIGLFCGRWTLMALGEVDYGLNGLIGGLTVFLSFFNGILAGATARFYAYSVGAANVAGDKDAAIDDSRRWFNVALGVHSVVSVALIVIGYPLGVYAIRHWLTIDADRVVACVWVFRFVCISCFVGMISVPFQAMYTAKQYIAELTIYEVAKATLNVCFLYYMIGHPDVWLAKYAAWTCALSVVPQIIICIRVFRLFPECRFNYHYICDWTRIRQMGGFSGWHLIGVVCGMLRTNGMSIVINKFFGAKMNAAQAIGLTVQGHCNTLAGAMQGAFTPVIVQACGARDYDRMHLFALRTCKFNFLLSAVFALPLALELPEVLRLWLKTPPAFAVGLCYCAMAFHLVECCTTGHMIAVRATGRIAAYNVVLGAVSIFTVPMAVAVGFLWHDVYLMMGIVVLMELVNSIGRVLIAKRDAGMEVMRWVVDVIVPISLVLAVATAVGVWPRFFWDESFGRVCLTTLMCECAFLPLAWRFLLSPDERRFVVERIGGRLRVNFFNKGVS